MADEDLDALEAVTKTINDELALLSETVPHLVAQNKQLVEENKRLRAVVAAYEYQRCPECERLRAALTEALYAADHSGPGAVMRIIEAALEIP
jgi:regulator of replication initiation timing